MQVFQDSDYSPLPSSNFLSKSVPIRRLRRRIPARQCLFRRFRCRIPVQVSAYLPPPPSVEFLQDTTICRFRRRIPVQVSAFSPPPPLNSCKSSQCLFAASAVKFLQDSFAASAIEFLVQVSAYSPLPSSNSCKPSQRSPESLCCTRFP